jgi:hypothetical protein
MSAGGDVKVVLNVPTIAIPFGQRYINIYLTNITNAINSRGQNQGSKKATLQGNKGLYQQKRINIKNEALSNLPPQYDYLVQKPI